MPFDPKQLRADAKRLQRARAPTRVGTTAAVRAALPAIYDLRKDGVTWAAIAEALAQQGIVQGKACVPITVARLTALVSQIEAQERRKSQKRAAPRSDTLPSKRDEQLQLALPGSDVSDLPSKPDETDAEHELRTAAYQKLQSSLFKKE